MPGAHDIAAERGGMPDQVLVSGAGAVGLCLALALNQGLGARCRVIVADPALDAASSPAGPDHRAYAVAAAARRMLEALDLWDAVAPHAEPIHEMVITDSRTHDVVRPAFLTFAGERADGDPFAHIVMAQPLGQVLEAAARKRGIILTKASVTTTQTGMGDVAVALCDGTRLSCRLVVAADGARSTLRDAAGLGWVAHDYAQSGIVATIGHERSHQGRATEHFLPGGPFAMLPLPDDATGQHRSSIVWSEPRDNVAMLLALPDADFLREIETRFGLELGEICLLDKPRAFGLGFGVARRFVGARLALVGDAAHVVHPLAGQGLNLGLKDVASLAEILTDAARLGLDIGAADVLDAYEKTRRADTVMMGAGMDVLNRLFSNDIAPLRLARDLGLGLVERMPRLKRFFIAQAAGESRAAPRLMRGEKL